MSGYTGTAGTSSHIPVADAVVPVGRPEDLRRWVENLRLEWPHVLPQILRERNIVLVDDLLRLDLEMVEIEFGMAVVEGGHTMKVT